MPEKVLFPQFSEHILVHFVKEWVLNEEHNYCGISKWFNRPSFLRLFLREDAKIATMQQCAYWLTIYVCGAAIDNTGVYSMKKSQKTIIIWSICHSTYIYLFFPTCSSRRWARWCTFWPRHSFRRPSSKDL